VEAKSSLRRSAVEHVLDTTALPQFAQGLKAGLYGQAFIDDKPYSFGIASCSQRFAKLPDFPRFEHQIRSSHRRPAHGLTPEVCKFSRNYTHLFRPCKALTALVVRRVQHNILASCHCAMDGSLPITRTHNVTGELELCVKEHFPQIARVTIHPEPVEER
jgi:zinc transporter family protein